MISVCIPVYNLDVRKLAESLVKQASGTDAEIILIDDASVDHYRELNSQINEISYHQLDTNIGRAGIRNLFARQAKHDHLLFLDCDSIILSDAFLAEYLKAVEENPGRIICGGRIYDEKPPERKYHLHWKYGTRKESQPVDIRRKDPNRSFMTNNFLVPKKLLTQIPFNENLKDYGHEDSLFGYELARKGEKIIHIDNPVLHGDLQSNREFLDKTALAVKNLVRISDMLDNDPGFSRSITLLNGMLVLESKGLRGLARVVSFITTPLSRLFLSLGFHDLKLLDIYKLGLYLSLKKKE